MRPSARRTATSGAILLPVLLFLAAVLAFGISPATHAASVTISDGTSCSSIGGSWSSGTCSLAGTYTVGATDTLTIPLGTTLDITASGSLGINSAGDVENSGTIDNSGSLNINLVSTCTYCSAGIMNNYGTLNNYGTVNDDGELEVYGTFYNYGTTNDNYQITPVMEGVIYNENGGTLIVNGAFGGLGGSAVWNYGTMDNYGTVTVEYFVLNNYGTFDNEPGGTIDNYGTINNYGGTITGYGTPLSVTISAEETSITLGETAYLYSVVQGSFPPYSYQWLDKAPGASSFSTVTGATASSYALAPSSSGAWSVELQVSDESGSGTVTSNSVTITVGAGIPPLVPPTLSASPTSIQQGQSAILTSTAISGSTPPYSYVLYEDTPSGTGNGPLCSGGSSDGSVSDCDFVTSATTPTGLYSFVLGVSGASGPSGWSNWVTVTVTPGFSSPAISASPSTIDSGLSSTLSTTASFSGGTSPYTCQWLEEAPGGSSYSNLGGSFSCNAGDTPTVPTGALSSTGAWSFELQVADSSAPALVVVSTPVTVTVDPALVATPSATVNPVDAGQATTVSAGASGGSGTYTSYVWSGLPPGCSGSTGSFSCIPTSNLGSPFTVQVEVTDSNGNSVTQTFSLTVNADPTVTVVPASPATYDQGQSATGLTASVVYSGANYAPVEWFSSTTSACSGSSTDTGVSGLSFTPDTSIVGTTYYCAVVADAGVPLYSSYSNAVAVMVNPALTAPTVSVSPSALSTIDSGQVTNLGVVPFGGGTGPYTCYWLEEPPGALGYTVFDTFTTYCSTALVSGWSGTLSAIGTWSFELQVTDATGASVTSAPSTVTVNSVLVAPTVSASLATIDQGQSSSLTSSTVSTGTSPYTYQWYQEAPGDTTFTEVGGATSTSYGFSTTGSTAEGAWSFELQVIDSSGTPATVTSGVVALTVNSALTAPSTPSVSASLLDADQSLTATATLPSTGTPNYGWQWLVSVNDGGFDAATQCTTGSGSGVGGGTAEVCTIPGGTLAAGSTYAFELEVSDSASMPESVSSAPSPTVTVNSALAAPVAPSVSAASLYKSQTLIVTDATPTTGTPDYSWQWLVSTNGGAFAPATQCATSGGSGALGGATETCIVSGSTLTVGYTYNFELMVLDSASSPEGKISPATPTVTVQTPTMVVFACLPLTGMVGMPEVCGVVVNNDVLYNARPSGTVAFSGTLPPGMPTSCTLSGGVGIFNGCYVSWTPGKGTESSYSIVATYVGDSTHGSSSTHGTLTIFKRGVSTALSCTGPYTHNVQISCTVTVTDNGPGVPMTPTGTVAFTSSGPGAFSAKSCTLSNGGTAKCSVTFTPSSKGPYEITAAYSGDADHIQSITSASFRVT